MAWGAFGVLSFAEPTALPIAGHRFLCSLLGTVTICSVMVNLAARIVRVIREQPTQPVCGYAEGYTDGLTEGYTDGLDARPGAPVSPGVSRLVPTRR